jgi:hypothetical protein
MAFSRLSDVDKEVVRTCLVAILDGPWIEDWEFQTCLGIDRDALRELLAAWPFLDDATESSPSRLAINNCMNEVWHGVLIAAEEWPRWFRRRARKSAPHIANGPSLRATLIPASVENRIRGRA